MSHFWSFETYKLVEAKLNENIKVTIKQKPKKQITMNMKKTVDGNILIDERVDFYIFVFPYETRIVTIPKDYSNKFCTERQVKFFDYLTKNGLINPADVQAGELYGSFETAYLTPREENEGSIEKLFEAIYDFVQEEAVDAEISVRDIKNRLMNMVGRRDNETDPKKAKETEDEMYNNGPNYLSNKINSLTSPQMGTYFFE